MTTTRVLVLIVICIIYVSENKAIKVFHYLADFFQELQIQTPFAFIYFCVGYRNDVTREIEEIEALVAEKI